MKPGPRPPLTLNPQSESAPPASERITTPTRRPSHRLGRQLGRRAAQAGLLGLAALALAAPGAAARPLATPLRGTSGAGSALENTFISFLPVTNRGGETLALTAYGCAPGQQLSALYSRRRGGAELVHAYVGTVTGCQLNPAARAGTLKVRWGNALRVSVRLAAVGVPQRRRVRVVRGCYETTSRTRFVATGTFDSALHAAGLGRIVRTRLRATIVRFLLPSCAFEGATGSLSAISSSVSAGVSGTSPTTLRAGDQLEDIWGANESLIAQAGPNLRPTITFAEPADDSPAPEVRDTFALSLTGDRVFSFAANLTRATLNFASPVSRGTLSFIAGIGCPPTIRAEDGTFRGAVTVDDPVLGKVRFSGDMMSRAQLAAASADADKCAPVNLGGPEPGP